MSETLVTPSPLPARVVLVEVGLRDGLQNESVMLSTAEKCRLAEDLFAAGVRRVQATAFVPPARVPQMADAEALCSELRRVAAGLEDVLISGLALNARGLERAAEAGLHAVDIGVSASDTHSRRNTGKSSAEALDEACAMIVRTHVLGLRARAAVQCAFGCAYEGEVPAARVLDMAQAFISAGADALAFADSTGMAAPPALAAVLAPAARIAGGVPRILHLHDTRGLGLVNLVAALGHGVAEFDTAFGGLGGCPFIPGAAGNIATEDTVYLLDRLGIATGINGARAAAASHRAAAWLGRPLPGKLYRMAPPA